MITLLQDGRTVVKPDSDYGQISEEMWQFFHTVYGGGPELLLQAAPSKRETTAADEATSVR